MGANLSAKLGGAAGGRRTALTMKPKKGLGALFAFPASTIAIGSRSDC
jgi:hypothetical protein